MCEIGGGMSELNLPCEKCDFFAFVSLQNSSPDVKSKHTSTTHKQIPLKPRAPCEPLSPRAPSGPNSPLIPLMPSLPFRPVMPLKPSMPGEPLEPLKKEGEENCHLSQISANYVNVNQQHTTTMV